VAINSVNAFGAANRPSRRYGIVREHRGEESPDDDVGPRVLVLIVLLGSSLALIVTLVAS